MNELVILKGEIARLQERLAAAERVIEAARKLSRSMDILSGRHGYPVTQPALRDALDAYDALAPKEKQP